MVADIDGLAPLSACPHANVVFCPLYHAAHADPGLGCDDGRLDLGDGCAVSRDLTYAIALGRLMAVDPHLVATLKWHEEADAQRRQRRRNLRINGIH